MPASISFTTTERRNAREQLLPAPLILLWFDTTFAFLQLSELSSAAEGRLIHSVSYAATTYSGGLVYVVRLWGP